MMEKQIICPRCQTVVDEYTPDCPNCKYFIWGDDDEDGFAVQESEIAPVHGVRNIHGKIDDEDAYEDYCDYNDSDFVDFDDDGEDDFIEEKYRDLEEEDEEED